MSADMFIMLGTKIKGESEDDGHKEWCEVSGWSHSFEQLTSPLRDSSGSTIERCTHAPFTFTKKMDIATQGILTHIWSGKQISKVVFEAMRAQDESESIKYMTIEMQHVIITTYEVSGAEGDIPEENIGLTYGRISYSYISKKKKGASGKKESSPKFAIHDLIANKVNP